ncbi:hypothetical protein C2E23DRAFT_689354, partial [Lenzites betulinus]
VDALPDRDPDAAKKMTTRVAGEVKENVEPACARQLKNMHYVWMIKPDALAENPHWITSGRVAANGKVWGDAEALVEITAKGK